MDISHNYASFKLNDKTIFIDSFDNLNFEVRVGTIEKPEYLVNIEAKSTEELNKKLSELAEQI
jgi:hypothetical protein